MGEEVTAQHLKNKFLGISEDRRMLIEVFEYHNHQLKELEGTSYASATIKRYTTTLDHIKAFLVFKYKLNDIPLNRLKYSFITDLEHYFKVTRKCNHNTTIKYIKNFRKVINLAIKNGWLFIQQVSEQENRRSHLPYFHKSKNECLFKRNCRFSICR
uniref:phage integrase SAM-like domain-containing protein n=1 Tax=Sunxiuqinia indica TaxID=2692584 RepID=UPI0037427170